MIFPYSKILVVGCGGAGKSTFARAVSARFGLPVVHLDKLWWLPNWIERNEAEFDELLARELEKSKWVIDGNYLRTVKRRAEFADAAVMLDVSPEVCIDSIYARGREYDGKTRPDMTEGCIERVDDEFRTWVADYPKHSRTAMLEALENSGKPFFVFDTREKAYEWINSFDAME